jgi:hypothetical protein
MPNLGATAGPEREPAQTLAGFVSYPGYGAGCAW